MAIPWLKEERDAEQGPCTTTTMIIARGSMKRRRQEDKETTTTGIDTTIVCPRVCDNHHYSPEEEERLTTMVTSIGESAQGEGCHYDTTTGSTAMVTTIQDRLQERSSEKRPTTSSDYIIRLTDRLQSLPFLFTEKGPGVQGKRWPKYRYRFSCLKVRGGPLPSKTLHAKSLLMCMMHLHRVSSGRASLSALSSGRCGGSKSP